MWYSDAQVTTLLPGISSNCAARYLNSHYILHIRYVNNSPHLFRAVRGSFALRERCSLLNFPHCLLYAHRRRGAQHLRICTCIRNWVLKVCRVPCTSKSADKKMGKTRGGKEQLLNGKLWTHKSMSRMPCNYSSFGSFSVLCCAPFLLRR